MSMNSPGNSPEIARTKRRPGARNATGKALSKERLRLWLRMLRASRGMETELRERLRLTYAMTLPQFDVLAALARREDGITMTELSRYLMVSNGNVTGIIARLVHDGLVDRCAVPGDRRATIVRLTPHGSSSFAGIASQHESWVDELLANFDKSEVGHLIGHLDRLVGQLREDPREAGQPKGDKSR